MREFYWAASSNFGDAMNSWLWERVFPGLMSPGDGLRLVGVGSLIKKELSYVRGGRKIIFGTGSGYGDFPGKEAVGKWIIYFVRGPLTASALGLDSSKSIVDASWLVSQLPEYSEQRSKKGIIFVPHFSSHIYSSWERICAKSGLSYINPLDDSVGVLESIASAELAVVESLHGAIMADYFRTPWIPVRLSASTLPFKWVDWCLSVGLEYRPYVLPYTDMLHHMMNRKLPSRRDRFYQDAQSRFDKPKMDTNSICVDRDGRPSLTYSCYQKLRGLGVMSAKVVRDGVIPLRNVWPVSIWNEQQEERVSLQLEEILKMEPCLSKESMRDLRLSQLDEQVAKLIADYPSLVSSNDDVLI